MEAIKTIAFLGLGSEEEVSFIKSVALRHRVLILQTAGIHPQKTHGKSNALINLKNVEWILCEKEACWEADLIFIKKAHGIAENILDQISKVSVQKTIALLETNYKRIEKIFLHSKVVSLFLNGKNFTILFLKEPSEALNEVVQFLNRCAYKLAPLNPIVKSIHPLNPNQSTHETLL